MKNNYTNAYLVFVSDLEFFWSTARKYKTDALLLKGGEFGDCTPSFHLLSSLVFELFPKLLIGYNVCIKYKNNQFVTEQKIRNEISKEAKKFSHDLANLYKAFPELMKCLGILDINEFKNDYVWDYRIKLGDDKEILLKNIEAVRYGSFAKNRDIMTCCMNDDIIVELLNNLEKFIEIKRKEVSKILKESLSLGKRSK